MQISLHFAEEIAKNDGEKNCTPLKMFSIDEYAEGLKTSLACNIIYSIKELVRPNGIQLSTIRQREQSAQEKERELYRGNFIALLGKYLVSNVLLNF